MSRTVSADLSLVMLAATAWLHEHDLGSHAEMMDANIDKGELARALDRLVGDDDG